MKIKRVLQGTALTALAAAAWMGAGSTDASAANTEDIYVSVDNVENVIYVGSDTTPEVMVSIVQVKNGVTQIKNWDVYDNGNATIDLSKLNTTKDNFIAVMTDKHEPVILKIGKTDKPGKAAYNYKTEALTFGTTTLDKVEFRTLSTGWYGAEDAPYMISSGCYNSQGATLYMRTAGTLKDPVKLTETVDDKATKTITEKYEVYDIGSLPGKEVKLNIAKQANGPSLSGDYVKNTIKSKDGLPCRVVASDGEFYNVNLTNGDKVAAQTPGAITAKSAKTADLEKMTAGFIPGEKIVVEVRTDATEKKPASKWSRLKIIVPDVIPADKIKTEAGVVTNGAVVTSGEAISVNASYTEKAGKNGAKSYTDVVIENKGKSNVDIKLGESGKTTTVKASKSAKYKKTVADNQKLYMRTSGDKADKVWAGKWTEIGSVKFPADVAAATPAPTSTPAAN